MHAAQDLEYAFEALEPHFDAKTMEVHYEKHYKTYLNNLNKALENHSDLANLEITELLASLDKVPEDIRTAVRNNGGGFYNHSLFWKQLAPAGITSPTQDLVNKLESGFGSIEKFEEEFNEKATKLFGSGWVWLVQLADGKLAIEQYPLQDNPIMSGKKPILGIDVWEHAYYLKYQNRRAEYIQAFWEVINWNEVEKRLA